MTRGKGGKKIRNVCGRHKWKPPNAALRTTRIRKEVPFYAVHVLSSTLKVTRMMEPSSLHVEINLLITRRETDFLGPRVLTRNFREMVHPAADNIFRLTHYSFKFNSDGVETLFQT